MNGRPLISYADITLPYEASETPVQPPSKKRKKNASKHRQNGPPRTSARNSEHEEHNEGRELTHEEIWDDSALIDAWNAATEEYEAYHGGDKSWKDQPLTKSAL